VKHVGAFIEVPYTLHDQLNAVQREVHGGYGTFRQQPIDVSADRLCHRVC